MELSVGEVGGVCRETHVSINGQQRTGRLESRFLEDFNLYIQVFRRSGKNWLETKQTDQLTLSEQNRMGRASLVSRKPEPVADPELYHEQL
jgi:hypothetical protein